MSAGTKFLLDTNVLSETRKRTIDDGVARFFAQVDESSLFMSVLTLGEMRKGVALKRKSDPILALLIAPWVDGLEFAYADRILGIDASIATIWGELSSQRPRPVIDTLIAATAMVHDLTLVTRNTEDIEDIDVRQLNPWTHRTK